MLWGLSESERPICHAAPDAVVQESPATRAESARPSALSARRLSIVVLPFANLSGDYEQASSATTRHHGARLYLGVLTRSSTTEASPLDSQSVSLALRAGRMDRSGRPEGDNDIVEQYKNPSMALPRAP